MPKEIFAAVFVLDSRGTTSLTNVLSMSQTRSTIKMILSFGISCIKSKI